MAGSRPLKSRVRIQARTLHCPTAWRLFQCRKMRKDKRQAAQSPKHPRPPVFSRITSLLGSSYSNHSARYVNSLCPYSTSQSQLELQADLNTSAQNGLWATQQHNELLLDQAFQTAKDVYLLFSVNKSGEFYGYARSVVATFRFQSLYVSHSLGTE